MDTLLRPCADIGIEAESLIEWRYDIDKQVFNVLSFNINKYYFITNYIKKWRKILNFTWFCLAQKNLDIAEEFLIYIFN